MGWFVTYNGIVDADNVQFGPLPTQEMAQQVRGAIEAVEGHYHLWVVHDPDHRLAYDRDLTTPRARVWVRDTLFYADVE